MSNLPDYISSTRMPTSTPDSIVENGKVHFGTFDAPFKNLNLLDAVKPCGNKMPDFMKPSRLVEWEAFEVHMDEGALISAVYSTGPMGFSIFVWYDKKENKIYSWRNLVPKKKAHVASQLVDDYCYCKTKTSEYKIENDFLNGKARAKGFTKGKTANLQSIFALNVFPLLPTGLCPLQETRTARSETLCTAKRISSRQAAR